MPDELNLNVLRAYADGELSEEDARRVEALIARNAQWRSVLDAEQNLSRRVAQVMRQSSTAPAALREQLREAFKHTAPVESEPQLARSRPQAEHRERESSGAGQTERPDVLAALAAIFTRPQRVSVGAIAAVTVIVAAVVLYGIFGLPIDERIGPQPQPGGLLASAAEHVSQEHDRCASDSDVLMSKLIATTAEDAAVRLQSHLGVETVTVFDLSDLGYRFVGVGPCKMPGTPVSAHLIYRREVPGEPKSMMSIFVAPNLGQFGEKCLDREHGEGRWNRVCGGKGCRKSILHGSDDQVVYFLACGFADQVELVSKEICRGISRRGR